MQSNMFKSFLKMATQKCTVGKFGVYYGCYCNSTYDFDPLYFHLGDYEYEAVPHSYIATTYKNGEKFCYFQVEEKNIVKGSVILGDAFLRNYYVYHDVANGRMGLYGNHMPYKASLVALPSPGFEGNTLVIILIVLGAICGFCLCMVCSWYICCNSRSPVPELQQNIPLLKEGADLSDKYIYRKHQTFIRQDDDDLAPPRPANLRQIQSEDREMFHFNRRL
ncbi:unnamed protein product [Moneuplotes crassus]|uniref:Peptidase A1 domain-containing protein n=1 Tax=Euplotes crassus TaxID=5936 RepID=A0AAD1U8H3_EUPCR|nr:unnamed protein product [Moneuplotes crassus]